MTLPHRDELYELVQLSREAQEQNFEKQEHELIETILDEVSVRLWQAARSGKTRYDYVLPDRFFATEDEFDIFVNIVTKKSNLLVVGSFQENRISFGW